RGGLYRRAATAQIFAKRTALKGGGFAASKGKLRHFDNHPGANAPPLLGRGCCKTRVEGSVGAVIEGVNELSGEHIPLLEKEGRMRGQKYREATLVRADGVVSPARSLGLNCFAGLKASSAAIRLLRDI